MVNAPGIYEIKAVDYHADPVIEPSLSGSIAEALIARTPRDAWFSHPRLNPEFVAKPPTDEMDEGTALHAAVLERAHVVAVVEAPDWRTKQAQEARKLARDMGKVPVLAHRWARIEGTAQALRVQLAEHEIGDVLEAGLPEQTIIWQEQTTFGPVWCRCRPDWREDIPGAPIYDLKTTGGTANPEVWGRRMEEDGRAMRAAFYLRGCRAVGLKPSAYRFLVIERNPPHSMSVVECGEAALAMGEQDALGAIDLWAFCMAEGFWPGYPPFVACMEPAPWAEQRREERALRARDLRQRGFRIPPPRLVSGAVSPR